MEFYYFGARSQQQRICGGAAAVQGAAYPTMELGDGTTRRIIFN